MRRVGIIGVGDFGSFATGAFKYLEDFELFAFSDIAPTIKPRDAIFYRDYHDLIDDERIDVVYVATENYNHVKMSIEALERGKAVLCEKPIFINQAEKESIEEAVKTHNRPFKVNFVLPNSRLYRKIFQINQSQELGKLLFINIENYATETQITKNWYFNDSKSGGWFATSDIHFFELISHLSEEDLEVYDVVKEEIKNKTISTLCYLNMGDVPIVLYHHMDSQNRERCRAKFVFEQGELIVRGWIPLELVKKTKDQTEIIRENAFDDEIYHRLIAANFNKLFVGDQINEDFTRAVKANELALEANSPINRYRIV